MSKKKDKKEDVPSLQDTQAFAIPKQLEGKLHNVIETLKDLIRAEIHARTDEDPDSMGSYHEEVAFSDATKELINELDTRIKRLEDLHDKHHGNDPIE